MLRICLFLGMSEGLWTCDINEFVISIGCTYQCFSVLDGLEVLYCVCYLNDTLLFMINREVLRVHGKGETIGAMVTNPLNLMRLVRNTRTFASLVLCLGEILTHCVYFSVCKCFIYSDRVVLKDFLFFLFTFLEWCICNVWINLSSKDCI